MTQATGKFNVKHALQIARKNSRKSLVKWYKKSRAEPFELAPLACRAYPVSTIRVVEKACITLPAAISTRYDQVEVNDKVPKS